MRKLGTFTSLIMCVFLFTMVISASAYKTEHHGDPIHEYIIIEAAELYSNAEIDSYLESDIEHGSAHEDVKDHVYGHVRAFGETTYSHFWDADNGENDPVQVLGYDYPNAWQKAKILWGMALGEYTKTPADKAQAYEYLGHVAHLLSDMGVPAHAHEDIHLDDCYEGWMAKLPNAELKSSEEVDLINAGPVEIPYYDDPEDSLYYLFYTTNQVSDFFASDDVSGDTNDNHGGWMDDIYTELGMDSNTRPVDKKDLIDNDIGDNNKDGDLGRIRGYCFMYAIRAVAALYKLFEETTSAGSITTLVIDHVKEIDDHDGPWSIPDYYVEVCMGSQWYINRGNNREEEDFYPKWAFGRYVGTIGSVNMKIGLWDHDGINKQEQSDIDPKPDDRGLFMRVNLKTGDITGDVTGKCGNSIHSNGSENDASEIWFRILLPNIFPTVNAGSGKTVNEGDIVTFGGSFTDPNTGDTHTIEWDFGDGCTDSGTLTPTHIYADDGTYTVTLTVTDDHGLSGSDTLSVTVNNAAPTVNAGSDQTVNEGDLVSLAPATFNDKGTLDVHTATINWGDGTSTEAGAVSESPFGPPGSTAGMDGIVSGTHVYADNGAYTVTVSVTDDDGAVTADTITINVNNVAPTLLAGFDQTVNEGELVYLDPSTFNDKGTLDTHNATINWGDGTSTEPGSVSESPFGPPGSTFGMDGEILGDYVYADNGNHRVIVTVTDDDGAVTSDTLDVTVNNVAPTLDAGLDQTVNEGDLVSLDPATFNDKGTLDTHIASIDWGDGSVVDIGTVSESPFGPPGSTDGMDGTVSGSHVYADNGVYTITITVTDDDGGVTADTITITVNNVAPTVDAGFDRTVSEGELVNLGPALFNDKGTLDTHSATIEWGDGSVMDIGNVTESPFGPPGSTAGADGTILGSHNYGDNGVYTVTVTVTDDDGGVGSDTFEMTVSNVAPTIEDIKAFILVNFTLRAAGEKWHNVEMFIFDDGVEIGYAEVFRSPGSPDDQSVTLYEVKCDVTKVIEVKVLYTPLDDRVNGQPNGATPVWVAIDFEDGEDFGLHHTCNAKHPDTWEWNTGVNQFFSGHSIIFEADGSDPGSDDLVFDWFWDDGSPNSITTYFNSPSNIPDPDPSPWGTWPFLAVDSETHTFVGAGYYNVTLTLTDDDGGIDAIVIMLILM